MSSFIEEAGNEGISERGKDPPPVSSGRDIKRVRTINDSNDSRESNAIVEVPQNYGNFDEKWGVLDVNTFKHIYIVNEWRDERDQRRVASAILISSGISLPLQVKPEIALVRWLRRLFSWQNTGQKVLYLTLEALDQGYAVEVRV